jgi:GPH family glycoside/pentoside/hexuronide:cation symporter
MASDALADRAAVPSRADTEDRLPLSLKVGWGFGAFGGAVLSNAVGGLVLYYLAKIVGMPGWLAGSLLSAARLYDAFLDPVLGMMSDRTVSRSGRRRPYLLVGAFLSAIAMVVVFTSPFPGTGFETSAYVLFALLLFGTAYSVFNVPFLAMPAEMTTGYHERSSIHAWRVIFATAGIAMAGSGGGLILSWLSHGRHAGGVQSNSAGDYTTLALIFAGMILVSMLVAWRSTRGARFGHKVDSVLPWRAQLSSFLDNKPFLIIIGVKGVQLLGVNANQAAAFFMVVEVLRRSSSQLALIGIPSLLVSLMATPLLIAFSRRFGKRATYMLSAMFTGAAYVSWFWAVPSEPAWMLIVRGCLLGVGVSGNTLFGMSMLTDAIELDNCRTGLRREGAYAACYSFVDKFSAAMGPAVVGFGLSLAGFSAKAAINAQNYGAVRQATLLGVAYAPAACAVLAVTLLCFYRLNQAELAKARLDSQTRSDALAAAARASAASEPEG